MGSGETVVATVLQSISIPTGKMLVTLHKGDKGRSVYWGRYTMINIDRHDSNRVTGFQVHEPKSWNGMTRK